MKIKPTLPTILSFQVYLYQDIVLEMTSTFILSLLEVTKISKLQVSPYLFVQSPYASGINSGGQYFCYFCQAQPKIQLSWADLPKV